MNVLKKLTDSIIKFRNERDWKQFHTPKNMAMALSLEASEVLEHFLWKNNKDQQLHVKKHKSDVADELSDVLFWVLLMAHDLNIDLEKSFEKKLRKNAVHYPIEKVKGKATKYTQLT